MAILLGRIPLGRTVSRVLWLMVCVIMLAMCVVASWYLSRALACRSWPTTAGVIVSAEKVKHTGQSTRRQPASVTYEAKLLYSYTVNGVSYEGTRVSFGDFAGSSGPSQAASARLTRYPPGRAVTVYYQPRNPVVSVLETQVRWPSIVFPIGFALLALLCWAGFRKGWKLWLSGSR
jgi:hypothetical protein